MFSSPSFPSYLLFLIVIALIFVALFYAPY